MSNTVLTWLWVQVASSVCLAFVLGMVYFRVYRERFLVFWSLSFLSVGCELSLILTILSPSPTTFLGSQPLLAIESAHIVLVALAAISLSRRLDRWQSARLFLLGTIVCVLLLDAINGFTHSSSISDLLRLERNGLSTLAYLWFTVAFFRRHPLAKTHGGVVTLTFLAMYVAGEAAITATLAGFPIYSGAYPTVNAVLAALLPMGIAAGMVMMGLQALDVSSQALRESEFRYRTLVENSPDAILLTDLDGRILMCNQRTLDLYDHSRSEELAGREAAQFVSAAGQQSLREQMASALRGVVREAEYVIERKDGSRFPAEMTPSVQRGYDRRPTGFIIFVKDISKRKAAEEAQAKLEEQLRQAQRMEELGRLVGGVAHDFNNYLTVINGYCDLLLERAPPVSPDRENLDKIRGAGQRAANLTHQLLAYARRQILELKPVSLNELVEQMEPMLRRLVREDIEIQFRPAPGLGTVMVDSNQIERVLMNLVINAVDAIDGQGLITIVTSNETISADQAAPLHDLPAGEYVQLVVSDSGKGIDKDALDRIFEPFFTTKGPGHGTGLGLSTVFGIVRQSKGWVWADSEPGNGSKFCVLLPLVRSASQPLLKYVEHLEQKQGSGNILIVEDEEEVRKIATGILRRKGYTVFEAANGSEALRLPEVTLTSLVLLITDVVMPGMNGKELAERLVCLQPQLQVLYVSGYSYETVSDEEILHERRHFLPKPYSPDELTARVLKLTAGVDGSPVARNATV